MIKKVNLMILNHIYNQIVEFGGVSSSKVFIKKIL
jgi:hypothetical protein